MLGLKHKNTKQMRRGEEGGELTPLMKEMLIEGGISIKPTLTPSSGIPWIVFD